MSEKLLYQIAISLIKGIGPKLARNLIAYVGDVEEVFRQSKKSLLKVPGIGNVSVDLIKSADVLDRAKEELAFIHKHEITPLFYNSEGFPQRLKNCDDAPLMLFLKGENSLNSSRIISVVGTRKPTENGKINCEHLIKQLSEAYPDLIIVSGLAYGIDVCSHRSSISHGLTNYGVLAHGLDRIYPSVHRNIAAQMVQNGGLVTEFLSQTNPDRPNFVRRNRIVAGLCDALVVVESSLKGGAVITARIAHSYNRDVLAFPGQVQDEVAGGCNYLIKKNYAALIENVEDLQEALGWEREMKSNQIQKKLFIDFKTTEEEQLYNLLKDNKELTANELSLMSELPVSKVSASLLSLEFEGVVKSLPGNAFRFV